MRPEIVDVFLDVVLRITLVNHRHSCDGAEKVVLPACRPSECGACAAKSRPSASAFCSNLVEELDLLH
jgi:hypothetical protein